MFFSLLLSRDGAPAGCKDAEIAWKGQSTVIFSKRRKISTIWTDPCVIRVCQRRGAGLTRFVTKQVAMGAVEGRRPQRTCGRQCVQAARPAVPQPAGQGRPLGLFFQTTPTYLWQILSLLLEFFEKRPLVAPSPRQVPLPDIFSVRKEERWGEKGFVVIFCKIADLSLWDLKK